MRLSDPVEILYLGLMVRWQSTAPGDRKQGLLDGVPEVNSQMARLAYVLKKIAAGQVDITFSRLEALTGRRDGSAYISLQEKRLENPHALLGDWYLEGCTSLEQKRKIIRELKMLGLSPTFVRAVDDFVSAKPIDKYFPTNAEAERILRQIEAREQADNDLSTTG